MNVIKTIFYIILFYYAFKFIMRLLLPVMVQKTVQHMEQTIRDQSGQYQRQNQAPPSQPKQKYPHETKKVGEYVDFEEID
jgi:hypothetical protein